MRNMILRDIDRRQEAFMNAMDRWSRILAVAAVAAAILFIIMPAIYTIISP